MHAQKSNHGDEIPLHEASTLAPIVNIIINLLDIQAFFPYP
jgi:hypothetical protein